MKLERTNTPAESVPRRARDAFAAALLLALCVAAMQFAHRLSERAGFATLSGAAAHQLDVYAAAMDSELRRVEFLPSLLELDPQVLQLLRSRGDTALQRRVNDHLGKMSVRAGTISIFVMDRRGVVVAASNWQPESLVGADWSRHPIFVDAMRGGVAGSFSATTGSAQYYLAEALRVEGETMGVAVAKIGLDAVESGWSASAPQFRSNRYVVLDENDVVIFSSEPAWRFHPVDPELLRAIASGELLQLPGDAGDTVPFVAQQKSMARVPWRLVALSDASGVLRNARNTGLAAGFAVALAGLLALLFMQRHRSARQRLAATEALQRVHSEHNAQLRETNEQLRREVAEREHAEAVLREAQDGLVQAAKLALLGQMSAGVTHEINQPLTALRALADNARQLVELGRLEEVKQNLRSISELTQRMGRLTAQLKGFARKAPASRQSVPVRRAIGNALLLLDSRVRAERAQVNVDGDEQLCAACDSTRLEQVLVNLVANALDAMAGTDGPRRVSLRCWLDEAASRVRVRVCDTGSGIPDHAMSRLFEPFFTTKKPGEGLGLGLMISSQIVREWGGSLAGANLATGACFEFDLPLAREPAHA